MGFIFDLDQTIIDSSIAFEERKSRNWNAVYALIPQMKPFKKIVYLIKELVNLGEEVAIVTSSPKPYCNRVLNFLGITGVITVCYHDTVKHKPDTEPMLLAKSMMRNKAQNIIAIGDEENDIIAAQNAKMYGVLGYWGNHYSFYNNTTQPDLYCRDEDSLLFFIYSLGYKITDGGLRNRRDRTYQLFDYYPISKKHDHFSYDLYQEAKNHDNNMSKCSLFCSEFMKLQVTSGTYGIFVVPSSLKNSWNNKLTDIVVPYLVNNMGLIDCAKYILRHTSHPKQAFGGNRSVQSNLSTIELQFSLPPNLQGAFIIDDITTTGNIFEACEQLLCNNGVNKQNIYCAAIGGTV